LIWPFPGNFTEESPLFPAYRKSNGRIFETEGVFPATPWVAMELLAAVLNFGVGNSRCFLEEKQPLDASSSFRRETTKNSREKQNTVRVKKLPARRFARKRI